MGNGSEKGETVHATALRQQQLGTIGLVAAGLVHDFRNILTVVGCTLSLLDGKEMDASLRQLLIAETGQTVNRGKVLAQRLLNLSGEQEGPTNSICLVEMLASLRVFIDAAVGPDVTVLYDTPSGLPPIRADRGRLELALLNLVTNARDAMPAGGTLRISSDLVQSCSSGAPTSYVHLTISDSGQGMDEATLQRATEPFFTTKGSTAGSGIGLWLVRSFVEEMGGNVSLSSSPGVGTTAELWFPALDHRPPPGASYFAISQI